MSGASVAAVSPPQVLRSELFGTIEVAADQMFTMPDGLYGFPECRNFALLPSPREGLYWLVSSEFSALAFLLVDPFAAFPAFHIELGDTDLARLGVSAPQDVLVLSIVTMPTAPGEPCTANLHAPLLFNARERRAYQSIRGDESFSIREPFHLT